MFINIQQQINVRKFKICVVTQNIMIILKLTTQILPSKFIYQQSFW